jgi:AcrR family transcriptional regulator
MNITRSYASPVRDEAARATEHRILLAAEQQFFAHGYPATTVAMIAAAAGVSKQTVYNSCGAKPQLLKRLYDVRLVGDDEPVPFAERPEIRELVTLTDPRAVLIGYGRVGGLLTERLGPLLELILAGATSGDRDLLQHLETTDQERLQGSAGMAGRLGELKALRPGLTVERARDIIWTVNSVQTWMLLTRGRGWSQPEYANWVGQSLVDLLLDHG